MHEWGLASNLIIQIQKEGNKRKAKSIKKIKMKIGTLSGVSIEAFSFAFASLINETIIDENALEIEQVDAKSQCLDCGNCFDDPDGFNFCSKCSSIRKKILCGQEMSAESIILEE